MPETNGHDSSADKIGTMAKEAMGAMHGRMMEYLSDVANEVDNAKKLLELKKLESDTSIDGYVKLANETVAAVEMWRDKVRDITKRLDSTA